MLLVRARDPQLELFCLYPEILSGLGASFSLYRDRSIFVVCKAFSSGILGTMTPVVTCVPYAVSVAVVMKIYVAYAEASQSYASATAVLARVGSSCPPQHG